MTRQSRPWLRKKNLNPKPETRNHYPPVPSLNAKEMPVTPHFSRCTYTNAKKKITGTDLPKKKITDTDMLKKTKSRTLIDSSNARDAPLLSIPLCVCMCMCVYVCVYDQRNAHDAPLLSIHLHNTCVCVCMYVYASVCMFIYVHSYVHICIHRRRGISRGATGSPCLGTAFWLENMFRDRMRKRPVTGVKETYYSD